MTFASVANMWSAAPLAVAAPMLGGQPDHTFAQVVSPIAPAPAAVARSKSDFDARAFNTVVQRGSSLSSKLMASRLEASRDLARIAPRLAPEWRKNLSWQLAMILDPSEWDGDEVLDLASWKWFLRGLFVLRPRELPGLGISDAGNLVASWAHDKEHVDIEFRADGQAKWLLAAEVDEVMERASGRSPVTRLAEVIQPYSPRNWFAA